MGRIISSYVFPHPAIIVPEVGRGREKEASDTLAAVRDVTKQISNEKPNTIIITTPHGAVFQDYIYISTQSLLKGDFSEFGADSIKVEFKNNIELVNRIVNYAKKENIYAGGLDKETTKRYNISSELDHGALVPLYFVNKSIKNVRLVHISIADMPFEDLYKFGMCISKAIEDMEERVVFISSGDLSHKLSHDAPYGYSERGREFDELLVNSMKNYDVKSIMKMDEGLCESAGECGLRSFIIMFGAMDGYYVKPNVLSYEGPFGVGYAVARFEVLEKTNDNNILGELEDEYKKKICSTRDTEDIYVSLARKSLECYVTGNGIMPVPKDLPGEMLENRAGAFVSLKKNGKLRGCIGTTGSTRSNIAEEIIYNAVSAGTQDPRFDSVQEDELNKLVYTVDILKQAEPIESLEQLDAARFGVIVRSGYRSGVLLPNLEGIDTPEEQLNIALQKAGIRLDEKYSMERFEVIRHGGHG